MESRMEHRVLLSALSLLSKEQLEIIKKECAGELDCYLCLIEAIDELHQGTKSDRSLSIKEDWHTFAKNSGRRFSDLMERYIERYQKQEREAGRKGSLTQLKTLVSNHSKWHRMMKDRGIGKHYHDDMLRLCVVFRLSYAEATELLWSAGQPFDPDDRRDYAVANCLAKKQYDPEEVDRTLSEFRVQPLFFG